MSLDPNERLAALRREIEQEAPPTPPPPPEPSPTAPAPQLPPAPDLTVPTSSAPPPTPARAPASATASVEAPAPATQPKPDTANPADDGWGLDDIADLLFKGGVGQWVGIGLVVVGGYLVLSLFVPGIEFLGSLLLLVAGIGLLAMHFVQHAPPWTLYMGAVLTGIGGLRVAGAFMPFETRGLTAIGLGLGLLAIGYLRRTQAGGWGWQGVAGAAALGFGLLQFAIGLLPGDTGLIDLVVPVLLLGAGAFVLLRLTRDQRQPA
jgi:hypothetical protein